MRVSISLLALLLLSHFTYAQKGQHPQPNPELQKEMRTYIEKEVVPTLKKEQKAFDKKLSKSDRAFLEAKREEVQLAKEAMKARHEQIRTLHEQGMSKEEIHSQLKAEKPDMHAKKKAFAESMKPFLDRNAALIETTMATLAPSYETWIAQQKTILEKYEVEVPEKAGKEGRHGLFGLSMGHKHRHHHGHKKGPKPEEGAQETGEKAPKEHILTKEQHQAMAFLLWDGKMPPAREPKLGQRQALNGGNAKVQGGSLQAAPNPVSGSTKLTFNLEAAAENSSLTIATKEGTLVRTLELGALNAGANEYLLNVEDLAPGVYFYTLEAGTFRATKRLVVQ